MAAVVCSYADLWCTLFSENFEKFQGKELQRFRARKEVILSGGAINTPQLLMLSGVGNADHLRGHGIDVVQHLPGMRCNLGAVDGIHSLPGSLLTCSTACDTMRPIDGHRFAFLPRENNERLSGPHRHTDTHTHTRMHAHTQMHRRGCESPRPPGPVPAVRVQGARHAVQGVLEVPPRHGGRGNAVAAFPHRLGRIGTPRGRRFHPEVSSVF